MEESLKDKNHIFNKIDKQNIIYDNFYKKVILDILEARKRE
jgi:hypothetical protein